tara:strand:+ start:181 stop:816 length:636 start_codon:yes stop_codon:yes gene_type:complete
MADSKISALPASTTPLAGTEVLPIVQSSTTRQVSVANLTAGRAISATQLTLTTGSLIVASGQGVDFSATPNTGTSELFDDYEEGTWTGALVAGTSGTITMNAGLKTGSYTKVGRLVTVTGLFYVDSVSSPVGALTLTGLPYATPASNYSRSAPAIYTTALQATATSFVMGYLVNSTSEIIIAKLVAGIATAMAADVKADTLFAINLSYVVE